MSAQYNTQNREKAQQKLFNARTTCPCGKSITTCLNCTAYGVDCCGRPVGDGRERPALYCKGCGKATNFVTQSGYCSPCANPYVDSPDDESDDSDGW